MKAADKISALIKCVDEAQSGNAEFKTAEKGIHAKVDEMAAQMPEVADFVTEFLPATARRSTSCSRHAAQQRPRGPGAPARAAILSYSTTTGTN